MSDKHNINLQHDENYEIRTANNLTIKPFLEENFSPIECKLYMLDVRIH